MGSKRWIVGACVLSLAVSTAWAGEAIDATGAQPATEAASSLSSASATSDIEPWIHGDMPENTRARLEDGFDLALEKVRDVAACRDLFEKLGADPIETLQTGLYFPINSHRKEKAVCGRAVAYTNVGAAPTFLCRDFARLSTERAAMYVIHEALHHAGLTEKPHDKGALTSRAINALVTDACQL